MSLPFSTPSTPLHRPIKHNAQFSNYTAPVRSKVHGIPLPPQELPDVISEFSLRKPDTAKLFTSPNDELLTTHFAHSGAPSSLFGSKRGSNVSSRPNTPTRRLSNHLSIRRRRRSSTGVLYDSAYAGRLTKTFLRDMAKALVREKQVTSEEPSERVFKALDQQFRLNSLSPDACINDFDYSLPLPSDNELISSDDVGSPGPIERAPKKETPAKPAFKSYLERIIALRSKKARHSKPLHSIFDSDSSENVSTQDSVNDAINTSRFVIENTLSGLPDVRNKASSTDSAMKLAEPVAFGSMNDANSSNDSSEKEILLPSQPMLRKSIRSSQISLGNYTPDNYDNIHFEKINQLDVPSYEPIPFYDHDNLEVREMPTASPEETPQSKQTLESDTLETEMIQGHFTIDDDNLTHLDPFSPNEDFNSPPQLMPSISHDASPTESNNILPSSKPITTIGGTGTSKRTRSATSFPNNLMKGFAHIAQNISFGNSDEDRAIKRRKQTFKSSYLRVVAEKSEEFLESVMADLTAYAEHRNSREINISDAVLYFNRIQSSEPREDDSLNFAATSRRIFPLESLQSLDISLQESALKVARNRAKAVDSESISDWTDDNDTKDFDLGKAIL